MEVLKKSQKLQMFINFFLALFYFVAIQFLMGIFVVLALKVQGKEAYAALEALEEIDVISFVLGAVIVGIAWWKFKSQFFIQPHTQ